MEKVRVFGEFENRNDIVHRNVAYLQWGNAVKSLGSFLLLNPGSALPLEGDEMTIRNAKFYESRIDNTMRQIVKLVENIYKGKELNGRVYIYNLFTLRNTVANSAIPSFENLVNEGKVKPFEAIPTKEELQRHPWICFAWGINSKRRYSNLENVKKEWQEQVITAGIRSFGKKHRNNKDYYHLLPPNHHKQKQLIDDLTRIYGEE